MRRLAAVLGADLVGVFAAGSFALGDFDPARSDLDVIALSRGRLSAEAKRAIVEALRHEQLACPVRGLELVVYREAIAREPTDEAGFELNLNTGPLIGLRVDYEPGAVERHWFPIDRAIAATCAVALHGPPAEAVFAPLPRSLLLPVVREALAWHLQRGVAGDDDAVLNACRALRYVRDGVWSSKGAAGAWALDQVGDAALVEAALAQRDRRADLGRERVERLVRSVLADAAAP